MNIKTRCSHEFVELTVEDGGTTVTTTIFNKDQQELNSTIRELLEAAYDLAGYTDKKLKEHVQDLFYEEEPSPVVVSEERIDAAFEEHHSNAPGGFSVLYREDFYDALKDLNIFTNEG